MAKITKVLGRQVFDSRGNPTVEAEVILQDGTVGTSIVPSGASTGSNEAVELRDNEKDRYSGNGVKVAVQNVRDIIGPRLKGLKVTDQLTIDKLIVEELDGSKSEWGFSKEKLGANAILAVSMAVCRGN